MKLNKRYIILINIIVFMLYLFVVINSFTSSIWISRLYFTIQCVCYIMIRKEKSLVQSLADIQRLYWMCTQLVVIIALYIYMFQVILTLNINLYPLILILETTIYSFISLLALQKISPYKITY